MQDVKTTAKTLEGLFGRVLSHLDPQSERTGLLETPKRATAAWMKRTEGYRTDPMSVLKVFEDGAEDYDQLIVMRDIPIESTCEHHLLPFYGVAHIGYLPARRIVGLSKLVRIARVFARRLQVQERLTTDIGKCLAQALKPKAVGVVVECRHKCMECRGVEVHNTVTITSDMRGLLREDGDLRNEFFHLINPSR